LTKDNPGEAARGGRPLPLAGVKVLDICQVMAGPFACMLLADMGAEVIKIEPPQGGDQTRGALGEHNREVLAELGIGPAERAALEASGAFAA